MQRTCAFCGGTPVTKEHVLPGWFRHAMPEKAATAPAVIVRYSDGEDRRHKSRGVLVAEAKAVCSSCNSGWMSDLEGRVKPVLLPMMQGQIIEISPTEQEALAAWTLKTALMFQHVMPQASPGLEADDYRTMYEERLPNDRMRVHTGYMLPPSYLNGTSPFEHRSVHHVRLMPGSSGGEVPISATVVTMRLGYAVLQLFSVQTPGVTFVLERSGLADYLVPLWPTGEAQNWPPRALKGSSEFDRLADPLGPAGKPWPPPLDGDN